MKRFLLLILIITSGVLHAQLEKPKVKLGIDVLSDSSFKQLAGEKIVLFSNNASRASDGKLTAEILKETKRCELIALMTPEHGFFANVPAGKHVKNNTLFNIPVYSLYGERRKPAIKSLNNCDAVVVDVQDIGIRAYTYISSVYYVMDVCADLNIPVYVLDRPNPLGGMITDGATVEPGLESFVGIVPVSYLHGCTIGELTQMINEEGWLPKNQDGSPKKCDLRVIKMRGWERWMAWEDTGLEWTPTSPHIPTVDAARGAAVLGTWGELGVISVGIGTTSPFQYFGSPRISPKALDVALGSTDFPGMKLIKTKFSPFYGMYNGKECDGFYLSFSLNNLFTPYTYGVRIMSVLAKIYPDVFNKSKISKRGKQMFRKVTGSEELFDAVFDGKSWSEITQIIRKGLDDYLKTRAKYLMY